MGKGLGHEIENGKNIRLAACLEIFNNVSKKHTVMVLCFFAAVSAYSCLFLSSLYHCLQEQLGSKGSKLCVHQ